MVNQVNFVISVKLTKVRIRYLEERRIKRKAKDLEPVEHINILNVKRIFAEQRARDDIILNQQKK